MHRMFSGSASGSNTAGRVGSSILSCWSCGGLRHGVPRQVTCAAMYHNIHRSELAIESGCSIPADSGPRGALRRRGSGDASDLEDFRPRKK
eukprot:scaffold24263_cov69-Phaeocystis_antarctica.AAC.5